MSAIRGFWGRAIANVPRDITSPFKRTCSKCKEVREIRGGSIVKNVFRCGQCSGKPKAVGLVATALLSGCALQPQSIDLIADHTSHISQHFQQSTGDYGYNVIGVAARWQEGRFALDVSDGVNVNGRQFTPNGTPYYGALIGSREVFNARISYSLWQKP